MTQIVVDPKTWRTQGTKRPFRCLDLWSLNTILEVQIENFDFGGLSHPPTTGPGSEVTSKGLYTYYVSQNQVFLVGIAMRMRDTREHALHAHVRNAQITPFSTCSSLNPPSPPGSVIYWTFGVFFWNTSLSSSWWCVTIISWQLKGSTTISNTKSFSGEELTIGLAVLSGVLLLVLLVVLYLFFKMWSTHKNAIKKDFNPLYGVDYEGDEVGRSLSVSFLDFLRNLPAKLERRPGIR